MKRFYSVLMLLASTFTLLAQSEGAASSAIVPRGWHLLDPDKDGQFGISLSKAYEFLAAKKLKSKPVLVAVIDSGIDTLHEDLQPILWKNPKEIPGNGVDDDKNGYVDDIHGWNFLGNANGKNVEQDSYEGARVYHGLKTKYEGITVDTSTLNAEQKYEYLMWKKAAQNVLNDDASEIVSLPQLRKIVQAAKKNDSILRVALHRDRYTGTDVDTFVAISSAEKTAKNMMIFMFRSNNMMDISNKEFLEGLEDYYRAEERKAEAREKAPQDYRAEVVGDNENDWNDRHYGNNNVMVSLKAAEHGTHVSGIIAAVRNNQKGMDGIADNVKIMMVRAVPDGDEHDKDVALAIRYAVDNGARIINMSFGKSFSPGKKWVDEAVQYAASKRVLLVHAAGNDHKNIDSTDNFPSAVFLNNAQKASNWITVGASANGDPEGEGLTANFSNYGQQQVDVFAPGSKIYATVPGGNEYRSLDGTSMASPVVAGVAALLLSYFPDLTPEQLKYCLETGSRKPGPKARIPGSEEETAFSSLCKTGGIVNAYDAVTIAASIAKPANKSTSNPAPAAKPKKS